MRLLYIADGRSPIALNWMQHFVDTGHEVHLISTYPCRSKLQFASLTVIPVAFTNLLRSTQAAPGPDEAEPSGFGPAAPASQTATPTGNSLRRSGWMGSSSIKLRSLVRHWLGPWTVRAASRKVSAEIGRLQPELVHAMRIPFEGMLAAAADPAAPLLLSVWGNDFTLHAPASPAMRRGTLRALERAWALHTDCQRDQDLAIDLGFDQRRPSIVLPGGGGIRAEIFSPSGDTAPGNSVLDSVLASIPEGSPVVINPRGFRGYVRNDTFFRSIPLVLAKRPEVVFLCPAMQGDPAAKRWLAKLKIGQAVRLLPRLGPEELAAAFRASQIMVSPSEHDGTPNTLLEAMACGAFPIAGDLRSLREWIEPERNGLLIDPGDPPSLANAILRALEDPGLRAKAAEHNREQIMRRAQYPQVMAGAERFYRSLLGSG